MRACTRRPAALRRGASLKAMACASTGVSGDPLMRINAAMPGRASLVDLLKPGCRQRPVLPDQRNDISNGAHRHQVAQVFQIGFTTVFQKPFFSDGRAGQ
jgi:hypothetical protein